MHWRRWLVTVVFCFAVVGLLSFVKYNQVMAAIAFGESFPEPSETVKVESVGISTWQPSLKVIGSVLPTQSLEIRNELEGVVTYIGFKSGGKVEKGAVLLRMQIDDELAQLDAIDAEITIAELDANRFQKLFEQRASSRDQYERAKAQLAVSIARKRSLEAVIAKKTVIAAFSGQAGLHELEIGAFLSADTVTTKLVSDSHTVWVDFNIPQTYSNLTIGTNVSVSADNLGLHDAKAVIAAVDQEISTRSRNIKVRAKLTSDQVKLKPGAIVTVSVPVYELKQVVRLSSKAIRYDTFGSYVFKLTKDDKDNWRAARQVVNVIYKEGESSIIEIASSNGLALNDVIATQGSFKLREGILVYIDGQGE
ncbi:MAG: membrane fusion protein (multidrug efflux system) [Glaciecola sp.]|jgi:membrane fusion protein (multidrug efflux system)